MQQSVEFEAQISAQSQRLTTQPLDALEREVAAKRRARFTQHRTRLVGRLHTTPVAPRVAFELLFFEYMGLTGADLPILTETPAEIAWLSRNPCPTLEACQRLGLDTRTVCRRVYEKSTRRSFR